MSGLEKAISDMRQYATGGCRAFDTRQLIEIINAAEAWAATLPQTKMVEAWNVEFAERSGDNWDIGVHAFRSKQLADEYENGLRAVRPALRCIRVTGPHQREIPA